MKTMIARFEQVDGDWYVVDVAQQVLGRVAAQIASCLRGKSSTHFTPHMVTGPRIIAINVGKIRVTGKKCKSKAYEHYTGYPGGLKSKPFEVVFKRFPERVLEKAVKGMLPKNALGRAVFRRFRAYPGELHPHTPQHPKVLKLG